MGKFRGHQEKSRRGREKKLKKKTVGNIAVRVNGDRGNEAGLVDGAGGKYQNGPKTRRLKHVTYGKDQSVLICGDGDFSFTRGVIRHRGTGEGVVATSLDSRKGVLKKYPRAENWLPQLHADGAQVVHCVDATRLEATLMGGIRNSADATARAADQPATQAPIEQAEQSKEQPIQQSAVRSEHQGRRRRVLFDRLVFNFPHTGVQRIHLNRSLIRDFFASTRGLVKCAAAGGEVHVTLKDKPPYSGWNIKAMAKESGFVMVRTLAFDPSVFPGYRHSTTDPKAKEFDGAGARTHVFCRARSALDDDVDDSAAFPVVSNLMAHGAETPATPVACKDTKNKANGHDDAIDTDRDADDSSGKDAMIGGESFLDAEDSPEEEDALNLDAEADIRGVRATAVGGGEVRCCGDTGNNSKKRPKKQKRKEKKQAGKAGAVANGDGVVGGDSSGGGTKDKQVGGTDLAAPRNILAAESQNAEENGVGLLPPLMKKKAAKRRAQRKKAAEAAKAALAVSSGVSIKDTSKDKSPETTGAKGGNSGVGNSAKASSGKRKRGKYVVRKSSEAVRTGGEEGRAGGGDDRAPGSKRSRMTNPR